MLRPNRFIYDEEVSIYARDNHFMRRKLLGSYGFLGLLILLPYVSVKAMGLADRLPIWD